VYSGAKIPGRNSCTARKESLIERKKEAKRLFQEDTSRRWPNYESKTGKKWGSEKGDVGYMGVRKMGYLKDGTVNQTGPPSLGAI